MLQVIFILLTYLLDRIKYFKYVNEEITFDLLLICDHTNNAH